MQTIQFNSMKWIRIALINFFIVALAGVVLRYKINFPLPLINQKYLLHGHSHFAFAGWVSLALMALMVNYLLKSGQTINYKKYNWMLMANTVTAYGMLITFIFQGYGALSIAFSTLSIFVSYFFIYHYWKDLRCIKEGQHITIWFKSALILLGVSSIGPFALAYLMANHIIVQDLYFSAIYFFLHFQYNGWFIFACLGLLFSLFKEKKQSNLSQISKHLFTILTLTVVPTYLLSILGLKVPPYLFWIAAVSAILQLGVLFYSNKLLQVIRDRTDIRLNKMTKYLWALAYASFCLKVILQSLSVTQYLGQFAFSLRPVIIGYLHLCFLGVISFFILGVFVEVLAKEGMQLSKSGLLIFILGVLLQEGILMVQAFDAIIFQTPFHTNIILFISAVVMATGLARIFLKITFRKQ
jgi:hypothetical protein